MNNIADIRKDYRLKVLDEKNVHADPVIQFEEWWDEVLESNIDEVNAMTLATCTRSGKPSARMVLLKGIQEGSFLFFTNYESRKGKELQENPQACLVFFWKELERQVRVEGMVEKISETESEQYYHSRPHGSKVGAWASPQSQVIVSREILEKNAAAVEEKFAGKIIGKPPEWGGYSLRPSLIEFWQGRSDRLHDRICYTKTDNDHWKIERLAP